MGNQKKYALGIDLGGTKTLVAVVDITTGEVIASERKRTHAEKGQEYMSQHITHLSAAACLGAQAAGLLGAQPSATVAPGLV